MDRRGWTQLHHVVEASDEAEVRRLLAEGASVDATDDGGRTPLMVAAWQGFSRVCGLLIDAGADMGARDHLGRTALHAAAVAEGGPPVLDLLLRRGADPHVQDDCGCTALHCALQCCNRPSAEVLVLAMRPLQQQDESGRTVLHWAAYVGYSTVVRQLLERGFSPWVKDLCGRDALVWAVESGVKTVVEQILQEAGYRESSDSKGQTALHVAAIKGTAAVAALLLDYRADAARMDSKGRTPLMFALRDAHRDVARILATRGPAYVHVRDPRKRTMLHLAALAGDAVVVRVLLARGAPVNAVDAGLKTPAALAVERGHEEAAAVLVAADGFRVTRDCQGRTPLHGAAAQGWRQVALQLVSLGADPHERGGDMLSPVKLAKSAGHFRLADEMSRAGRS